jgi:Tol biopolymer transport system component
MKRHRTVIRWALAGVTALPLALAAPAWASPIAGTAGQPSHAARPAQGFDGRIVFGGQDCQLYTINPDGTALVQVTHFRSRCADAPAWSPDSTRIAFPLFSSGGSSIDTMNADGTDLREVTTDGPGYFDFSVDYTPDGKRIVFSRCRPDPPGGCALYSVRLDGTDRQALTTYRHGIRAGADTRPQVSPDGQWLTFSRFGWKGINVQVWLMPMDRSAPAHPITPARLAGRSAKWDASGKSLYFAGGPPDGYGFHVFRTPVSGSHVTQLTFSPWPNGDISTGPSPGGDRVAFISDRRYPDACCNELFIMHSDGSHQHLVTGDLTANVPDWGSAPLQHHPSAQVTADPTPLQVRLEATISRLQRQGPVRGGLLR